MGSNAARLSALAALGLFALACQISALLDAWSPYVGYAIRNGPGGNGIIVVRRVRPGSQAARAGLRQGDAYRIDAVPLASRLTLFGSRRAEPGEALVLTVRRGDGTVPIRLTAEPLGTRTGLDRALGTVQFPASVC